MNKYINKYPVIEAKQWFKDGDHKEVIKYKIGILEKNRLCLSCGRILSKHGELKNKTLNSYLVCPGDYIIKDSMFKNQYFQCKPEIFKKIFLKEKDIITINKAARYMKEYVEKNIKK